MVAGSVAGATISSLVVTTTSASVVPAAAAGGGSPSRESAPPRAITARLRGASTGTAAAPVTISSCRAPSSSTAISHVCVDEIRLSAPTNSVVRTARRRARRITAEAARAPRRARGRPRRNRFSCRCGTRARPGRPRAGSRRRRSRGGRRGRAGCCPMCRPFASTPGASVGLLVLARDRVLELAHPGSKRASEVGQPLGPEHHEHDHEHDDDL